jgi:hypothetical protein
VHDLPVRNLIGTADLVDLRGAVGQIERFEQVGQQILHRDGLRQHAHPARADHHRQTFHEGPDHLVGQAAGADHDRSPELDHLRVVLPQHIARFLAAPQVLGKRFVGIAETAQIDDPPDARGASGLSEIGRGEPVLFFKVAFCAHRMHKVVGRADAFQGRRERRPGRGHRQRQSRWSPPRVRATHRDAG